jgi:hypothetical protein
MTGNQVFLLVIALQEALAGAFYLIQSDWRRALIWVCYAVATLCITF